MGDRNGPEHASLIIAVALPVLPRYYLLKGIE